MEINIVLEYLKDTNEVKKVIKFLDNSKNKI